MSTQLTKGTVRIQVRKDTALGWSTANPILKSGEFGFETNTGYLKCGDGSTAWVSLPLVNTHAVEGENIIAVGITDGHVLTADGSNGADWEASAGGASEGTAVLSTGESIGKFLRADGDDSSSWDYPPFPQGTSVLSTGETGTAKFLRVDGDATCSWQVPPVGGSPEGTAVLSTGETGGVKFLREDGDDSCSWQTPPGGGGTDTVVFGPMTARIGSLNSDANFYMPGAYGVSYPFWSSYNQLADRDHGANDTNEYYMGNRVVSIPFDCTLIGMSGSFYSTGSNSNYLFEWWKATPDYPTGVVADCVFEDVGMKVQTAATGGDDDSYKMRYFNKSDGAVSLSAGDILAPYTSRVAGASNGYVYCSQSIWVEKT